MPRTHGNDARIYLNEFNLSGRANRWGLDITRPAHDITAFEDPAGEFLQGLNQRGWTAEFRAWSDFVEDEIDQIINSLLGTGLAKNLGLYADGSAAGSRGYEGASGLEREQIVSPADNAGSLDVTMRGNGMIGRAMKLQEAVAISGTGGQTGQNHMVATDGDTIISVLRVIAVDGAGSITMELQESTDDGGGDAYGTVVAHAAQTAVRTERVSVVASSNPGPWFRHEVTAFSGFTSATVRMAVAIVPNS